MKNKSLCIIALLLAGAMHVVAQNIQLQKYKDESNYLTKTLEESWYSGGKVYHGVTITTELLWPVSGLPAQKLHSLRQFILESYASDNVASAMRSKVDDANFHVALHNAIRKDYFVDGFCFEDEDDLRYVQPSQVPKNAELSFTNLSMELKRFKNGVYTLIFTGSDFCAGAAHPLYGSWTLNYDVERNRRLALSDIFQTGKNAEINRIYCALVNNWRTNNGEVELDEEPFSEELDFSNCTGWYVGDKGIVFLFNPYEIAPFSEGIVEVTFPVSKYKYLFRPEVLKYWNL